VLPDLLLLKLLLPPLLLLLLAAFGAITVAGCGDPSRLQGSGSA